MERKIYNALSLIRNNPRLFFIMMKTKIMSILLPLSMPHKSPVQKKINGVLFEFDFDLDTMVRSMYFETYEPAIIEVLKKTLKTGDTFIDVGASIGYLSCIAAGIVGESGQVHSFEPVPRYFEKLQKMAALNPKYKITPNNCALGDVAGRARLDITNMSNIGWNTMVSNFMKSETINESIEVPVYRLDDYIKERGLSKISLIKIDVEGFEFPVLKGLKNYFEDIDYRPVILCEIAPTAYTLLGFTLIQLLEYMKRYNYYAFNILNTSVKVDVATLSQTTNVVFKFLP